MGWRIASRSCVRVAWDDGGMVTSNVVEFAGKARMPRLGMGTMALSIEGRPDRATAIGTIHAALDAGVRYLDTAWSYYLPSEPGPDGTGVPRDFGYGEMLVHAALASWSGPRDDVLVATKTGYRRTLEVTNRDAEDPQQSPGDGASASASERQHLQAAGSRDALRPRAPPQPVRVDGRLAPGDDDS